MSEPTSEDSGASFGGTIDLGSDFGSVDQFTPGSSTDDATRTRDRIRRQR